MLKGHCHCGAVRWVSDGPVAWSSYCHCSDCRRICGSPVTAFFGVPHGSVRWLGQPPRIYQSSEGVERLFCGDCGTPVAYRNARDADNIHLHIATLEDPEQVAPEFHEFHSERLSWLSIQDDLPRHPKTAD